MQKLMFVQNRMKPQNVSETLLYETKNLMLRKFNEMLECK